MRIENPTAQDLQVHIIPPNGADAPVVGQIKASGSIDLSVEPGTQLGFSDGNNWIGETYVVAQAASQVISLPFFGPVASVPAGGATTGAGQGTNQTDGAASEGVAQQVVQIGNGSLQVRIDNPTNTQIVIYEIFRDGSAAPEIARVEPGFYVDVPAQAGALIGLSNGTDWVGGQYNVTADAGQRVNLPLADPAASAQTQITPIGNGSQPVGITNPTQQAFLVHYISPDKSSAPVVAEVGPGQRLDLPAQPGALIGFSNGAGWVGAQYIITAEARQELELPLAEVAAAARPQIGDGSVWLELHNPTGETLSIHKLLDDGSGAPYITEVGASGVLRVPAQPGLRIGVANAAGWVGGPYSISAQRMQRLNLPPPNELPPVAQIGNGSITVQVTNPEAQAILVHHIPDDGQPSIVVARAEPGNTVEIPAQAGVTVGFAAEGAAGWFGNLYKVEVQARQVVTLPAPIYDGQRATKVNLQNPTNKTYEVYRLQGEATEYLGSVPSGRSVDLYADMGMKLAFSDGGPFQGGFYTIPTRKNQTLRLPPTIFAGNGSRTLTVANNSKSALSVVNIPRNESENTYVLGNLAPGTSTVMRDDQGMKIGFSDEEGYLSGQHVVSNAGT